MTDSEIKYIIARVLDNAKDCIEEAKENPESEFFDGKKLAYYEVLDTIKNELLAHSEDLEIFGLNCNLEKMLF